MNTAIFLERLASKGWFIQSLDEANKLKSLSPDIRLLYRLGSSRFVASVRYHENIIAMIESSEDYLRDVSVYTQDINHALALKVCSA